MKNKKDNNWECLDRRTGWQNAKAIPLTPTSNSDAPDMNGSESNVVSM